GSAAELAAVIARVESRPNEALVSAGQQGQELVAREFRWDLVVESYLNLVHEVARHSGDASA
ncbi:MAG: hypothetical protein ACT4O1_10500, partial [Gemmatimonadota bacterium]